MNIFGTTVNIMNNLGLYAFAFLVPFILLYLIRPKIVTKTIPSLMFMMKEEKKHTQHSFLRKLMNNLIFILQLLVILLLAASVLNPIILTKDKDTIKNTFVIIDGSASMQTKDGDNTRFEKAVDIAKDKVDGNVNLMVAYNNEVKVPVRDGWASEARKNLDAIQTEDTITNIEAAMQKADQLLEKKNAKIIVISDFINVAGPYDDPLKAKRILTGRGNEVEFVDVSSKADNVGIVEMIPKSDNTQVYVKNFNSDKKAIKISVMQGTKELFSETRNILGKSTEIFNFATPQGESYVLLSPDDDFLLDNKAYLSTPNNEKIKVLLITSPKNTYLETALKSSKTIELSVRSPPFTIEQIRAASPDVIIVGKINKDEIVVGDFENLAKYINEGRSIIITAQEDMAQIDYDGLLPFNIDGIGAASPVVKKMENQFTKDAEFGTVDKYVKGKAINGTTVMLTASDDSPMLSFRSVGNGTSVYYGLIEDMSDFKSTPSYPIFWNSIVRFLVKTEDIKDYNKKTTETNGEKAGYITENGRRVAINLLNEKESDVGNTHEAFTEESGRFVVEDKERLKNIPIEYYLIIAALVILVIELLVIKKRGDL